MKYPNGIKPLSTKVTSHSNRGMQLENDINVSNEYYRENNIAIIHKKPTPIKIVKVDYSNVMIKEAYFMAPSTTDYNGIYKGLYIDFEAKETMNKTGFPINNIHQHQIEHLGKIMEMGGVGFIIIRFVKNNLTYYLDGSKLLEFIKTNEKKSIPLEYFKKHGHLIKEKLRPRIDYLKIVEDLYVKGGQYGKEITK